MNSATASPPAVCSACGHIFEAPIGVSGSGQFRLHLTGCGTSCPRCGGDATIADGVYEFISGVVRVIRGEPDAQKNLNKLAEILERARAESKSAEQIASEVTAINPALGEMVKRGGRAMGRPALIAALLAAVASCTNVEIKVDINKLIDQARNIASSAQVVDNQAQKKLGTDNANSPRDRADNEP